MKKYLYLYVPICVPHPRVATVLCVQRRNNRIKEHKYHKPFMKKVVVFLVSAVLLVGCSGKSKYSHLSDRPLPVEIEVVGESSQVVEDNYLGEIRPIVDMSLVFPLGGQLTAIHVKSGDKVKAGQLIATVDNTQAKSILASAEAMFAQAKDGYARLKPLHEKGGISDVKWVEMETNMEKARSLVISSRKRYEDCEMRAPQAGVVSMREVEVGQQLSIAQPIGQLMDLSSYIAEFTVPESEIGRMNVGQQVWVELSALNKQYEAKVVEKSLTSTHIAHTYIVKAEITDREGAKDLLPGMVCRAIVRDRESRGYIISTSCIQTQQRGHSVWVLRDGRAKRQMVKIGAFVENGVLITEGVNLGDTIISKGYQKMYDGARVSF